MSIQSIYDEILEDKVCLMCGHTGMEADGGFDYFCPECGYEGTIGYEEASDTWDL